MRILKIIVAILSIVCLFDMPYGYYQLYRVIAAASFVYFVINSKENEVWFFVWLVSAILVQPFFKIALGREIWNIVDVAFAALLIISEFNFSNNKS